MSDLISRQAAIDVINKVFPADPMRNDYTQGITCGAALANIYVAQLPSAQPETHEEHTETHACDFIERQAAISVIAKWMLEYGGEGEERERNALKQIAEEIKELSSAPQRTGRWIDITKSGGDFILKCSVCGSLSLDDTNFCPDCGAMMEGD